MSPLGGSYLAAGPPGTRQESPDQREERAFLLSRYLAVRAVTRAVTDELRLAD